jgi:hypothetical protein
MIFNKQFIAQNFEEKIKKEFQKVHPWETTTQEGEKTPYELFLQNYYTFYDLESDKMKEKRYQTNLEITENCFKQDYLDVYPNEEKINQCIREVENKHLGKLLEKRDVFFGNGK